MPTQAGTRNKRCRRARPLVGVDRLGARERPGRCTSSMQNPVASRRAERITPNQGRHRPRSSLLQKAGLRHEGCFRAIAPHLSYALPISLWNSMIHTETTGDGRYSSSAAGRQQMWAIKIYHNLYGVSLKDAQAPSIVCRMPRHKKGRIAALQQLSPDNADQLLAGND